MVDGIKCCGNVQLVSSGLHRFGQGAESCSITIENHTQESELIHLSRRHPSYEELRPSIRDGNNTTSPIKTR